MSWLGDIWYWIRCHTYDRFHIIDLRDRGEGHGYKWGWMDRDHQMLIACFTLLRDFVEKEDPDVGLVGPEAYFEAGHVYQEGEQEAVEQQISHGKEIRELYEWWVEGRAKEHAEVSAMIADTTGFENGLDIVKHPNFDEWAKRDEELDAKDDAQLLRLIKIRGHLWT